LLQKQGISRAWVISGCEGLEIWKKSTRID